MKISGRRRRWASAVLCNAEEKMKLKVAESYKKKNVCELCDYFLFIYFFFLMMLAGALVQLNVALSMGLCVLSFL
jgi:hypothetical protein